MRLPRSALLSLCAAAAFLAACKPSASPPPATKPTIAIFPMRGIIEKLPNPEAPRILTIRHESTKDMESMTMAFTIDPAVPLTGLTVGDKISFRYEIDFTHHLDHVTQIEKLPADTALNFAPPPTSQ